MLIVDDFVMLGKTVPEEDSQGRTTVCSAGLSAQLGTLMRLYPLSRYAAPERWTTSTVRIERNPKDNRPESWKLAGDRDPAHHDDINRAAFTVGSKLAESTRADLLRPYVVESVKEADEIRDRSGRHISLAIVQPQEMSLEFEHNPDSPDSPQMALFDVDKEHSGAQRFPWIPRLRFDDSQRDRPPMLRDWGVYERMRKAHGFALWSEAERRRDLTAALHLDPTCSLLIGNFNRHRNRWLVISVLRGLRTAPSLLDELAAVG